MEDKIKEKLWRIATRRVFPSPFFLEVEWGKPLDLKEVFPTNDKIFLELGSGWGEVAIQLALDNPDTGFVLLEKKPDRIRKTLKEIDKHRIINIRFLTANFNWFLTEFFQPDSFDDVLLNFPDPWPKSRHHKHRSFDEDFPTKLFHLLKPNGRFRFASDYGPYARQVVRILRKQKDSFNSPVYDFERENFPISYFESEKRLENKKIHYVQTFKIKSK